MRRVLSEVKEDYDFIIIDCSPSLGLITLNALTAADSVIIPVQCEYYALEGLGKLLHTITIIKSRLNKEPWRSRVFCSPCTTRACGWPTRWWKK